MNSRDVLQIVSVVISGLTLVIVARKVRRNPSHWRVYVPLVTIAALTMGFYVAVQAGVLGGLSSDLSATLRLVTQISILFYAWYMPPGSAR